MRVGTDSQMNRTNGDGNASVRNEKRVIRIATNQHNTDLQTLLKNTHEM